MTNRKARTRAPGTRRPPARPGRPRGRTRWLLAAAAVAAAGLGVVALLLSDRSLEQTTGGGGVRAEGTPAPPVVLPATSGRTVDLASFRGKRNVLLYFYEHAG